MTDAVEDYLRAVEALLPEDQRADIGAELRDLVLTRIEAIEAELGHPAALPQIEDVLRSVGHPLVVAARYRPGPTALVGPAIYPYWSFFVKAALTIEALVTVLAFIIRTLATGDLGGAFSEAVGAGLQGSTTLIGCATVLAVLVDRQVLRVGYLNRWRVRDLKVIEVLASGWPALRRGGAAIFQTAGALGGARRPPSWPFRRAHVSEVLAAAAGEIVFLLWWAGALKIRLIDNLGELRALGIDPGPLAHVDLARLRAETFWPVLLLVGASLTARLAAFVQPRRVALRGLFDVLIGTALLALAVWLAGASPLAPALEAASVARLGLRIQEARAHGGPFPLDVATSVAVIALGLAGGLKLVEGLVRLALAARPGGLWTRTVTTTG